MPLRTRVGAIWEMIPPAPMHSTLLFEKMSWSNPGIFTCRSVAPGTGFPCSLIDVLEAVNAGRMTLHSFPIDFKLEVLVQADKPHIAVTAKNCHQRKVAGLFETLLEIL